MKLTHGLRKAYVNCGPDRRDDQPESLALAQNPKPAATPQTPAQNPKPAPTPETPAQNPLTINTGLQNLSAKVHAWYVSGGSHLEHDEFDLAVQSFSKVISVSPTFPEPYLKRAEGYANLNQLDKAENDLKEFTKLSPDGAAQRSIEIAERFNTWGGAAARDRRFADALAHYARGLVFARSSNDLSARLLVSQANMFYAQQKFAEALEVYVRAQSLDPKDPDILARLITAKRLTAKVQDLAFTQSDCDDLQKLPAIPIAQLICSILKREQERQLVQVKPANFSRIFEADEVTEVVQINSRPVAEYTKDARALKLSGVIELSVVFSASGNEVIVIEVLKSLPSPKLVEAAKEAAMRIKFTPARLNSVNVAQRYVLIYSFIDRY